MDASVDGVNWTSIKQYNATDAMPISSPPVVAKIKLDNEGYRFIRWIYTTRKSGNVSLKIYWLLKVFYLQLMKFTKSNRFILPGMN